MWHWRLMLNSAAHTGINYSLQYIKIENRYSNNISQFHCIFDQINGNYFKNIALLIGSSCIHFILICKSVNSIIYIMIYSLYTYIMCNYMIFKDIIV